MIRPGSAAVLVAAVFGGWTASAQVFEKFGEEQGWSIFLNTETGGCFMERPSTDGFVVQAGVSEAGAGFGYLALYTEAALDVDPGATRPVLVDLDGEQFVGTAMENKVGIYSGGYVVSDDPEFFKEFAQRQKMTIYPLDADAIEIDLAGTSAAMDATLACQTQQDQ